MKVRQAIKKQILVVEDEGLIADDLQRRLERMGYSVPAIASSGEEALRFARKTPFDLVLMDIRIKGDKDGIAIAAELKNSLQMPVVYLTAHADQETIARAKITEPFGYLLKPITDGILGSTIQIAFYKSEMERRLRTSEAWLSTTLLSVGEGMIATNTEGEIVFMNPVAEMLTGWAAPDARGRLLPDVLALVEEFSDAPAVNPIVELLIGENRAYRLVSKNGEKILVEVASFENRSAEERLGSILVVRDIRARRDLETRLIQAQRMEAIAHLAGRLAHDFNNLLQVMLGYSDDLCLSLTEPDRFKAREIRTAASLASSLSNQLLTLSRHDQFHPEVLNLDDAIVEVQPLIANCAGRRSTLRTELRSGAFVRADRNRLKQVLLNLALNARDAMPEGGELRIETATVEVNAGSPDGRRHKPGAYVRLRVADSGNGMDETTLARIFEPYFTTRRPGAGSGLGLAIVHSIVMQGEGYISATSEVGKGTTFEILLPCFNVCRKPGKLAKQAGSGADVPTILLVDDEASVRGIMHKYLEHEGYRLLEAANGADAEVIAETHDGPIHVLVTDVVMAGMSGTQLAQRVKARRPDIKVLFVSGYQADQFDVDWALAAEAGQLTKPFLGAELVQRVRELMARRSEPSANFSINSVDDRIGDHESPCLLV